MKALGSPRVGRSPLFYVLKGHYKHYAVPFMLPLQGKSLAGFSSQGVALGCPVMALSLLKPHPILPVSKHPRIAQLGRFGKKASSQ
jgi:hypothetical protein